MSHFLALCVATTLLLYGSHAAAEDTVPVDEVMAEPGARLVAVEFWAEWCVPCKKALPRWKKLHKKYRDRGLRLIMVAVNSGGRCAYPAGWRPDRTVCDYTGEIAAGWFAQDLPQAFLWSWQGNLLVQHGEVQDVEAVVDRYFLETPRILVEEPMDQNERPLKNGDLLRFLVRNELGRISKFEMVASEEELEELRLLRRIGFQPNYDEATRCTLGKDISPNSTLRVTRIEQGDRPLLLFEVFSLERGCLEASAIAPIPKQGTDLQAAVIEGVALLTRKLISEVEPPSDDQEAPGPATFNEPTLSRTATEVAPTISTPHDTPPAPSVIIENPVTAERDIEEETDSTKHDSFMPMRAPEQEPISAAIRPSTIRQSNDSITKKWWFWTTLGVVAAGVGVGTWALVDSKNDGATRGSATIAW